jgi:ABC-2 type transport system ATP-binding protein
MVAVAGVYLHVPAGSFFGLVGPNGAGKTTALSMMTGLLRPDAGVVLINGADVWRNPAAVKAEIGVLPEGLRLFDRLSGPELLRYLGRMRGLRREVTQARADELLAVLDLAGAGRTLIVDYSTGMRKKIALAAALLHNPKVLFLDEPFEGVDPVAAQTIRGVLDAYTRSGSTVIFSSHVLELVESMCDRVAVMSRGQILASGPIDQVRAGRPLQEAFLAIVGARPDDGNGRLSWLGSSSG